MNVEEKVKHLRSLQAAATTRGEAEAAAAAVERLITKYQLDEAAIFAAKGESEPLEEAGEVLWRGKSTKVWLNMLANGLCSDHSCALVSMRSDDGTVLRFAGTRHDTELVRYLFTWLSLEIDRLARRERGHAAMNAFRVGAVSGVLRAMRKARAVAVAETNSHSAQMVLVDRAALAMNFLQRKIGGKFKLGSGPSLHDAAAYNRGWGAGSNLTARHGLAAGTGRLALGPARK